MWIREIALWKARAKKRGACLQTVWIIRLSQRLCSAGPHHRLLTDWQTICYLSNHSYSLTHSAGNHNLWPKSRLTDLECVFFEWVAGARLSQSETQTVTLFSQDTLLTDWHTDTFLAHKFLKSEHTNPEFIHSEWDWLCQQLLVWARQISDSEMNPCISALGTIVIRLYHSLYDTERDSLSFWQ